MNQDDFKRAKSEVSSKNSEVGKAFRRFVMSFDKEGSLSEKELEMSKVLLDMDKSGKWLKYHKLIKLAIEYPHIFTLDGKVHIAREKNKRRARKGMNVGGFAPLIDLRSILEKTVLVVIIGLAISQYNFLIHLLINDPTSWVVAPGTHLRTIVIIVFGMGLSLRYGLYSIREDSYIHAGLSGLCIFVMFLFTDDLIKLINIFIKQGIPLMLGL